MKRDLFDLLDGYEEETVDFSGGTPLSASRIKELTMKRVHAKTGIGQQRKQKKRGGPLFRGLLVAAVIASLCCLTAFAIVASLRNAARADLGISQETPILEWTEYAVDERAGGEVAIPRAELMATMCSGEQLYAYLTASPVSEETAQILAENESPEYEWDLSGISPRDMGLSWHTEQISYDPETQTALVKVDVWGEGLDQVDQIQLTLAMTHNLKEETVYGQVAVPVTESRMRCCPVNIPITTTNAHMEAVLGSSPDMPEIPAFESEGRIRQISICAGYLQVEVETPSLAQWLEDSGMGQMKLDLQEPFDLPEQIDQEQALLQRMYLGSWNESVVEAMEDAVLIDQDGASMAINTLPQGTFAGTWVLIHDSIDEGRQTYRLTPGQVFDLSGVVSITVDGTEYPFASVEKMDF